MNYNTSNPQQDPLQSITPIHNHEVDFNSLPEDQRTEMLILKQKFEENEAQIIHDLYDKHFRHKEVDPKPEMIISDNTL